MMLDVSKQNGQFMAIMLFLSVNFGAQNAAAQVSLEEVVVTAQKREQNLQDVPIAISVFSEQALDARGVVDIAGIAARTPGFTMGSKDAASSQLSIRGIGSTDDGAAADNSVIVYVDEVPIGRAAGMELDLFDLERIEVLRGPQGTLFGRNAVGGAVNLVTSRPDEALKIKLEGKLGSFHQQDLRALISGQIAENVFGKIAFSRRNRAGYLDSTIDQLPNFSSIFPHLSLAEARDIKAYDIDRSSYRGALRLIPDEALEINITAAYSKLDQAGAQRVFIGDFQQYGGFAGDALFPGLRDDYSKEFFEDPGFDKIDSWSMTLRADYTFDNEYLLTSITSWREIDTLSNDVTSTFGQARAILQTGAGLTAAREQRNVIIAPVSIPFEEKSESLTQEIRLTSPDGERLEWVAGAFFLSEDVLRDERVILGLAEVSDRTTNAVTVHTPPGESGDRQDATVRSYAVFGQADYELIDALKATVGLRYTLDQKGISRIGTADGIVVAAPFSVVNDATFNELTYRVGLAYKPVEDLMLYGSFSRGFKSGGFQGRGTTEASVRKPFEPEIAKTYEIGAKATFFAGRLQINPVYFHTDFNDLQVVELLRPAGSPPGTTASLVTQNAANAKINGGEIEYSWLPVNGLSISGAYTWLDAEYVDFFPPAGFESTAGVVLGDRAGNRLLKSPEYSVSQLVRYEWPAPFLHAEMALQGEYIYKARQFGSADNAADVAIPAYDVVNFSLTFSREGGHAAEVSVWIENAFDENYLLLAFAQGGGGRATPAPPRTVGVTLRWQY